MYQQLSLCCDFSFFAFLHVCQKPKKYLIQIYGYLELINGFPVKLRAMYLPAH